MCSSAENRQIPKLTESLRLRLILRGIWLLHKVLAAIAHFNNNMLTIHTIAGHFSSDGAHFVRASLPTVVAVPMNSESLDGIMYPSGDCAIPSGQYTTCDERNLQSAPPAGRCTVPPSDASCDHFITAIDGPFMKVSTLLLHSHAENYRVNYSLIHSNFHSAIRSMQIISWKFGYQFFQGYCLACCD